MEWIAQLQGKVVGLDASFFLTNDAREPSLPELTVLVLENLRI